MKDIFDNKVFFSRKYRRIPVNLEIEYKRENKFKKTKSINISQGGVFILTDAPLPMDEKTVVKIVPYDNCLPLELKGRVAWTTDAQSSEKLRAKRGMGVEFIFQDEYQKGIVGEYVSQLFSGWLTGKSNQKRDV